MMIRLFANNIPVRGSMHRALDVRCISQTSRILSIPSKPTETQSPASTAAGDATPSSSSAQPWTKMTRYRTVTGYDKRMLVWTGKYKSIADVPESVSTETLDKARDRFRVKMCIYMMLVCTAICVVQVIRGKRAAQRGESVVKSNLDWHREYNEAAARKENATK